MFSRIFDKASSADRLRPLYDAVVRAARDPAWYRDGQVPDTMEGRFDLLTALTALALLRLEHEAGQDMRRDSVLLTELFIADMEGTLRHIGIGDFVVGKRVGKLVGALGGRVGALREAGDDLTPAVRHNVFHDAPPSDQALAFVALRLRRFRDEMDKIDVAAILGGKVPLL